MSEAKKRTYKKTYRTAREHVAELLSGASIRARNRGIPWNLYVVGLPGTPNASRDLALDRLLAMAPKKCPVLKIRLLYGGCTEGRKRNNAASLDRIDPALGYVLGNVRWISWRANQLKCNGTLREFRAIIRDIKRVKPDPEAYLPVESPPPESNRDGPLYESGALPLGQAGDSSLGSVLTCSGTREISVESPPQTASGCLLERSGQDPSCP